VGQGVELSSESSLSKIDRGSSPPNRLTVVRLLLPVGWALAAIGYLGPWIGHPTAALTLSGVDLGEFVKFLPDVLDGTSQAVRQLFYLPPFAVVVSVALLIGLRRLGYPWLFRALALILAVPVSLQLLPPAWSPSGLMTKEFYPQTIALGTCWLLLAAFSFLGSLPTWLSGSLSAMISLTATVIPAWQFFAIKPSIDRVYGTAPTVGWGLWVCMIGLVIMVAAGVLLVLRTRTRGMKSWSSA
jgi:hypothetical protein